MTSKQTEPELNNAIIVPEIDVRVVDSVDKTDRWAFIWVFLRQIQIYLPPAQLVDSSLGTYNQIVCTAEVDLES